MMQECVTCGARWVETSQPSPVTHCPWCGALLSADGETPTTHPATLDQPLAPQLHPQQHQRRRPARWLRGVPGLGVLALCVLLSLLLYALVQSGGFRFVVAPSAFSNSNAAANSNASSASGAPTVTLAGGPGGNPPSTTRTPALSPSPATSPTASASPTATPIPPTLDVSPTSIQITLCVAAQRTFTVSNTGGAPFSWTATAASGLTYKLSTSSGTLGGGELTVVQVSNILSSGNITVTGAGARNSPQYVTITCTA